MKPFNLEEALAGEPVVCRNGWEVTEIVYMPTVIGQRKLFAVSHGTLKAYDRDGKHTSLTDDHELDLFMAPESKFIFINLWQQLHENGNYFTTVFTREDRADMEIENNFRQLKHIKKIKITL